MRVAAHQRRYGGRRHGTDPEHMPSAHRRYAEWTPDRFRRWGRSIGAHTETLIIAILANRPHPEQGGVAQGSAVPKAWWMGHGGFRTCLGILRLYRGIDVVRAEAASATAVEIGAFTCSSVASILGNAITSSKARKQGESPSLFDHPNVRGAGYFN